MKKIAIVLIALLSTVSVLDAQEIAGKKILKTAKKMIAKGQNRDAVSMMTRNIGNAGNSTSEVWLQLGTLQKEILLLDSANISLNEALKSTDEELKLKATQELELVAKQKEKYNFNLVLFKAYIRQKDWVTASMSGAECLNYDTGNYEVWFGFAEVAEFNQSVDASLAMYQKTALKYIPTRQELAHVYEHISEAFLVKQEFRKAIEEADKAIETDKFSREGYYLRGKGYFNLHDYQEAEKSLNTYLAHIVNNKHAWELRGDCYFYLKRYSSAIVDYTKAIQLDSSMTDAYSQRGKSYYFTKQYSKAELDFAYLNTLFQNNYYAINAIGLCAYQQEKYDKAVSYFKQVIKLSTQDSYQFNLAMAYYKNKQLKLSLAYFDQLAQSHRYEPNYNVAKTWVLLELNELSSALNWINASIKENPYIKEYYAVRAKVYRKMKETKKAEKDERIAYTIEADPISFELKF